MLPRRFADNGGHDMSDEEDATSASKLPSAKAIQGWNRVGTLLPIIGHRSKHTAVNEPLTSEAGSLRASFTRQIQGAESSTPRRQACC